jgi:protein-tyrosine phosphatase
MPSSRAAVLFVCLGNICRSPLAEGAMRREAARIGLEVEVASAGTAGWHVGEPPDRRARAVAARHGVDIGEKRGRQVAPADFRHFTHIVALDRQNLDDLRRLAPADATARLSLLLDHVAGREGEAIADPYYGGPAEFETTWSEVEAGTRALAAAILGASGDLSERDRRPRR